MKLIRFQRPDILETPTWNRLSTLREELDRLFDSPWNGGEPEFFGWTPLLDVYEDKDSFVVKAELPGMSKEDIELSLHDGCLTIAGERRREQKGESTEPSRSERYFGRFQRTFSLPKPVHADKVQASYKAGILTVTLPKTEESKPKQIEVKVS